MNRLSALSLLVLSLPSGWASASAGKEADTHTARHLSSTTVFKSQGASAAFESRQKCITTTVTVEVEQTTQTSPGAPPDRFNAATLVVRQVDDPANGTPKRPCGTLADPVLQDSRATVLNPSFTIDSKLKTARLKGTADFADAHAGTLRRMKFEVSWKGHGGVALTPIHSEIDLGDTVELTNLTEQKRLAQACATVEEKRTNYTPKHARNEQTSLGRTTGLITTKAK
jgi:hypothetical protein